LALGDVVLDQHPVFQNTDLHSFVAIADHHDALYGLSAS
jgi:hypothetical protein